MKKTKKYLWALLLIGFSQTEAICQELIVNGGFETGDLSGWNVNNCNIQSDPAVGAYNGNMKSGYGYIRQTITVVPEEDYSISFKYKTFNGTASIPINATIKNSSGDAVIVSSDNFDLTTLSYLDVNFSFTVPSGVSSVYFEILKSSDAGGNNAIKIDDISITLSSSVSTPVLIDPVTPSGQQPFGQVPGVWTLDFSDEFNGSLSQTPNEDRWIESVSTKSRGLTGRDPALSDWWWKKENVSVNGVGQLELKGEKFDSNTMYCGSVETVNNYEPTYGYFEARIQIAETSKANHTAFWFQGHNQGNVDNSAADGAEIDVFESAWVTDKVKTVLHYDGYASDHVSYSVPYNSPGIHSGYHVFAIHWTSDFLQTYYDGVPVTSTHATKVFPIVENTSVNNLNDPLVPQVPEWLWISIGASFGDGDFAGQPIGTLSSAKVDWVRAYKPVILSAPRIEDFDNLFKIFPNPASDLVKIETEENNYLVKVFSANGQLVDLIQASKFSEVNVGSYKTGLYLFKITSNKVMKTYKVFVK